MKKIIENSIKVLDEVIEKLPFDENKSKLIDLVIELRCIDIDSIENLNILNDGSAIIII